MKETIYNRDASVNYAKIWAYKRNPKYYNFDNIGGDCTSFVSQCLYEGCKTMNYKKHIGWYYNSIKDRAPSWSGVEFLYDFLTKNRSVGPSAIVTNDKLIEKGDIIQLKFSGNNQFSHSLFVVNKENDNIFVAAHTDDVFYRSLLSYEYNSIRFLHINKVITWY